MTSELMATVTPATIQAMQAEDLDRFIKALEEYWPKVPADQLAAYNDLQGFCIDVYCQKMNILIP